MKLTTPLLLLALISVPAQAQDIPTTPVLEAPAAYTALRNPEFRWQGHEGAAYYYLWVDDGSGRDPISQWITAEDAGCATGTQCYCTLSEWIAGETQWWVKSWSEPNLYSDWSAKGTFVAAITGLYPPVLPLPPEPPE